MASKFEVYTDKGGPFRFRLAMSNFRRPAFRWHADRVRRIQPTAVCSCNHR